MKTLVELFKWGYEGEYTQEFYAVDNVEEFLKEATEHLAQKPTNNDEDMFWWSEPLRDFRNKDKVYVWPLASCHIQHINNCWFLKEHYNDKTHYLEKAKWNSHGGPLEE